MEKFEFALKNGKQCRLEASYKCDMEDEIADADGWKVTLGKKPTIDWSATNLVAYIDGQKADASRDPAFWRLHEVNYNGQPIKKIWGLKICIADPEIAARYEKWIDEVIDAGSSAAVKEYKRAQEEKEHAEKLAWARATVKRAEAQRGTPSSAEVRCRLKQLNDVLNEGGEGWLPRIVSREEYENALEILAQG